MTSNYFKSRSNTKLNNRIRIPLFLTLSLILATYFLWGFYWGWLDDIIIMNELNGIFFCEPGAYSLIKYAKVISDVSLFFKKYISPNINYYSIFLYSVCFSSILYIIYQLSNKANSLTYKSVFIILFYFAFLVDSIYMIDFTTVAGLAIGVGIFGLFQEKEKKIMIFPFLILLAGLLLRAHLSIFFLPFVFFLALFNWKRGWKIGAIVLLISAGVILSIEIKGYDNDIEELEPYNNKFFYYVNDGKNSNSIDEMLAVDRARSFAYFSWFWGDINNTLTDKYIAQLNIKPIKYLLTADGISEKLHLAFINSCCNYDEDYTPHRNWIGKGALLYFCFVALVLIFIFKNKSVTERISASIFLLGLSTMFILTAIIFKIEYRVFYPVLLCAILGLLFKLKFTMAERGAALLVLGLIALFRLSEYNLNAKHLNDERTKKMDLQTEIRNTFNNKLLVFDLYTSTLVYHNKFFLDEDFGNNKLLIFGDYVYNFSKRHRQCIEGVCGESDMVGFFECLSGRREEVVLVLTDFRATMYELYLRDIYGYTLSLQKMDDHPTVLNSIIHSFHWDKRNMNYYVIDKFEIE